MAVEVLPRDEHNGRLVANVHPPDWVSPEPPPRYNLVVIGAGTAGLVTAAGVPPGWAPGWRWSSANSWAATASMSAAYRPRH